MAIVILLTIGCWEQDTQLQPAFRPIICQKTKWVCSRRQSPECGFSKTMWAYYLRTVLRIGHSTRKMGYCMGLKYPEDPGIVIDFSALENWSTGLNLLDEIVRPLPGCSSILEEKSVQPKAHIRKRAHVTWIKFQTNAQEIAHWVSWMTFSSSYDKVL